MALTIREYLTADGKNSFREWLRDFLEAKRHGKTK